MKYQLTFTTKIFAIIPHLIKRAKSGISIACFTNRVLNNYMKSHLIRAFSRYLSDPFVEAALAFGKVLSGK